MTDEEKKEKKRRDSRAESARNKRRTDPESNERYNAARRKRHKEKRKTDPVWRENANKVVRDWVQKQRKINPGFREKRNEATVRSGERYLAKVIDLLDVFYEKGCSQCPEVRRVCLCAHHRNPKIKIFSIGSASTLRPTREILKRELKKCTPLCLNCHAGLHALQRQKKRKRFANDKKL